jgi:hypothetical protein
LVVGTVPEPAAFFGVLVGLVGMVLAHRQTPRHAAEIVFEPSHFNKTTHCNVLAAWVAYVETNGQPEPKWPCGDTRGEAVANVLREFPGCEIEGQQ